MCGITGFVGYYNNFGKDDLKIMNSQIAYRGPDDEGFYIDELNYVALAHKRLSILDLSPTGHQPMKSKSQRFVIVYNGEIYNFNQIKKELDSDYNIEWDGHSDTEVLLEALEHYGIQKALNKCNGMFAIALYDKKENFLYLARDRHGKKPLYYTSQNGVFVFGSELKSIVKHSSVKKNISVEALDLYFKLGYIPTPYSIYQNIYKLEKSSFLKLEINSNQTSKIKYYTPDSYKPLITTKNEALLKLNDLLEDSVSKRMIADVGVGSFLSAGIDSTIVTSLMQRNSRSKINTYTIGFDVEDYNEAPRAKQIAKHLGTNHHEHYLTQKDVLKVIPELVNIYDEPFSDFSALPSILITKLASKDLKVMLSGDGGDELFGGYSRYFLAKNSWEKVNSSYLSKLLFKVGSEIPLSFYENKIFELLISSYTRRKGFVGDKIGKFFDSISLDSGFLTSYYLLNSVWKNQNIVNIRCPSQLIEKKIKKIEMMNLNYYEQMMYFDRELYLPDSNLVKIDRASMSNSLEVRSPLLDYRILEFSNTLDTSLKISGINGKIVLKQLLNKYVPDELMNMPKTGFSVPMGAWLRNELKGWAYETLSYGRDNCGHLLDFDKIFKHWNDHQDMRRNYGHGIWSVVVFLAWHKNNF